MAEHLSVNGHDGDEVKKEIEVDTILERLSDLQEEVLTSLKEDISDWIIKTLGETDICADNFIQSLDTGIILCKLSRVIERKAQGCFELGLLKERLPTYKLHWDETASSGTWYARDNAANFLKWGRAYGMPDHTLFDSEDLVSHHDERQVIYCLMELARIGARYGLEPPSLISMEKEIDSAISPSNVSIGSIPLSEVKSDRPTLPYSAVASPLQSPSRIPVPSRNSQHSILDNEVLKVSRKCECENHVSKLSEGLFDVYGKQVFIRLLKGKRLMVRVGGGWDTFENYLLHHVPIKVFRFGSQSEQEQKSLNSENSSTKNRHKEYLVIRSKYTSNSLHS